MRARILLNALLASTALFAACSDGTGTLGFVGTIPPIGDTLAVARIRFINATTRSFDFAQAGVVATGNGSLQFGMASRCITVASSSPDVVVRTTGTTVTVPGLDLVLQGAGRYAVIAFTDVTGATRFVTLFTSFAAASGLAGFSVFNAVSNGIAYDVYVTPPTIRLSETTPVFAAVLGGVSSSFVSVDATSPLRVRVTAGNATTVLLDLGNVAFVPNASTILIIAPPLPGTSTLRAFLVTGC